MLLLWLLALVLAFAPGALLLWYIRRIDKYEPEPWSTMGLAFLAGVLSTIPAIIIEKALPDGGSSFVGTIWGSFIVAGMTEELCKGSLGLAFMWRRSEFNEVMDGIVYFGLAHMGFAITENLLYIFTNGNIAAALMTGFMRTTTAVPLHVINGMIMGYFIGMARYTQDAKMRMSLWFKAFAIPIMLHGFYDLAAFNKDIQIKGAEDLLRVGFGTAALYAAVVALWVVLMPKVKAAQDASPWKPQEWPTMPVAPTACPNCGSAYPYGANYCHMCATPVADQQAYYQQQAPGAQ